MATPAALAPRMVVLGEGAPPDGVTIRGEEAEGGGRSSKLRPGSAKKPGQLARGQISH